MKLNGRPLLRKGHFSSPCGYLVDTLCISKQPLYLNKSLLHQKYVAENLPAKKIALEFEASVTTIKYQLKVFGLKKLGPRSAMHRQKLTYGQKIIGYKLEAHSGETQIIRSIKKMYLEENLGPVAIARILSSIKVPTKKRRKRWDHSAVIAILEREGLYKVTRNSPEKRGINGKIN